MSESNTPPSTIERIEHIEHNKVADRMARLTERLNELRRHL